MPLRRVAPALAATSSKPVFATMLQTASTTSKPAAPRVSPQLAAKTATLQPASVQFSTPPGEGPAPISASQILQNADQLLNVPYVWGGTSPSGLDCSAYVSRAWGVSRHTTDNLSAIARPVDVKRPLTSVAPSSESNDLARSTAAVAG